MESKDEVSDTDSGIILQSGPDSPVSPVKELTHAVRKGVTRHFPGHLQQKQRMREEAQMEKKFSILPPLRQDPQDLSPPLERQPLTWLVEVPEGLTCAVLVGSRRRSEKCPCPSLPQPLLCLLQPRTARQPADVGVAEELSASDDSSLSDGLLLEEEESQVPKPPPESPAPPSRPLPPQSLEGLKPAGPETGGLERAPIQNSPWKETSLDHPYEKPRKSSEPNSESSSPATTPQDGPGASSLWLLEPASYHVVPIRSVPGQRQGRTSAPATPEMQGRRGQAQSLRLDSFRAGPEGRGRSAFPRRRPTHYTVTVPDSCFPPTKPPLPHPAYHSCSEDSGSDVSSISHPTSPGSSSPDISFLRPLSPPEPPRPRGAWVPAGAHYPKLLPPPGRYVLVAESHLPPPGEWELGRAALGPAYEEDAASLRPKIPTRPSCTSLPHPPGLWAAAGILAWQQPGLGPRPHPPADLLLLFPPCQLGPVLSPGPAYPNLPDREGDKKRAQEMRGGGGQGAWHTPKKVTTVYVPRRSPEGAPVQVFVPENGEIISQV
ncbi:Hypothetical predicted protein [Lynx pardinus]|uniref:Uncharacterized protein n=1 Tax=Lynx pardinus TaxID=191816 RepID=A0A485NSG4_LYNPA|nr:Hypothetical predicted protein [Lynx pardinus]